MVAVGIEGGGDPLAGLEPGSQLAAVAVRNVRVVLDEQVAQLNHRHIEYAGAPRGTFGRLAPNVLLSATFMSKPRYIGRGTSNVEVRPYKTFYKIAKSY